jgi:hypothetical protein
MVRNGAPAPWPHARPHSSATYKGGEVHDDAPTSASSFFFAVQSKRKSFLLVAPSSSREDWHNLLALLLGSRCCRQSLQSRCR